ncbi:MAG: transposase [Planctomycetota bacterium]
MGRKRRDFRIGVPHHVTHRGNLQAPLFETDIDRRLYLSMLHRFSRMTGTLIGGYCLMTNHVHFIVVPEAMSSISTCFGRAHRKYSEYLNVRRKTSGTNWEGRFFSTPMDPVHAANALRYVERNPVEAGLVTSAEEWEWSSAAHNCGKRDAWRIVNCSIREESITGSEWRGLLKIPLEQHEKLTVPWITIASPEVVCDADAYM